MARERLRTLRHQLPAGPCIVAGYCGPGGTLAYEMARQIEREGSRVLAWPGRQYVLGTDRAGQGVAANLPSGQWRVAGYDAITMTQRVLAEAAGGRFVFDVPASRAAMTVFTRL
jgi:hypothetical protein